MVFEAPLQSIADVSDVLVEREVQLSILDTLVAEPVEFGSVLLRGSRVRQDLASQ
jgi:hypothetical protein